MRIISGKYKGRIISFPMTKAVRPMMDRVRESLFSTIGEVVESADVLDLFAGSGSIGFEALSRGAQSAVFVEQLKDSIVSLRKNKQILGVQPNVTIMDSSVDRAIKTLSKKGQKFSLIFMDPPYNKGLIKKTLKHIVQFDILRGSGWLVIGHSQYELVPEENSLNLLKTKKFGESLFTILIRPEKGKNRG